MSKRIGLQTCLILFLVVVSVILLSYGPSLTGMVVLPKVQAVTLNTSFFDSEQQELILSRAPEHFVFDSISIDGHVIGEGKINIYFHQANSTILLFNSSSPNETIQHGCADTCDMYEYNLTNNTFKLNFDADPNTYVHIDKLYYSLISYDRRNKDGKERKDVKEKTEDKTENKKENETKKATKDEPQINKTNKKKTEKKAMNETTEMITEDKSTNNETRNKRAINKTEDKINSETTNKTAINETEEKRTNNETTNKIEKTDEKITLGINDSIQNLSTQTVNYNTEKMQIMDYENLEEPPSVVCANEEQCHNRPPTHTTPILKLTEDHDLICLNQSTYDPDGDRVKNIFNWFIGGRSLHVLNMPFEGGYRTDYSGYGNIISHISGRPRWYSFIGHDKMGAFYFPGRNDEYIMIKNSKSLNVEKPFTVSVWIKPFKTEKRQRIISKGNERDIDQFFIRIWQKEISISTEKDIVTTSRLNLQDNRWYHIVGVFSKNLTIYVNGEKAASKVSPNPVQITDYDLLIGAGNDGNHFNREYVGLIDDITILETAVSDEQAVNLYKSPNVISKEDTLPSQVWKCSVTPNDGKVDGKTLYSNEITIPPVFSMRILSPIPGSEHNITSAPNITVRTSAETDLITATLTKPSGETQIIILQKTDRNIYSAEIDEIIQKGRYNITVTAEHMNVRTWFNRTTPEGWIIDAIDRNTEFLNYSVEVIGNSTEGIDLKITFVDHPIKEIIVYSHDVTSEMNVLKIDGTPVVERTYTNAYAIDPTFFNFTYATVFVNSSPSPKLLWKCSEYNFTTGVCAQQCTQSLDCTPEWQYLKDTTEFYNFTITHQDPLFIESINNGDASVYEGQPDMNYGGLQFTAIRSYSSANARSYIQYSNLTKIINNTITQAHACFYYYEKSEGSDPRNISIYHVIDDTFDLQTEATITWNNQVCGVSFTDSSDCNLTALDTQTLNDTVNRWICFDVTDAVKGDYNAGDDIVSFALKEKLEDSSTAYQHRFISREYGTASFRPFLNISYENYPPTHTNPLINTTFGTNTTIENITCFNQSTNDPEDNEIKNIFNWRIDSKPFAVLNMPFENWNSTWTRDYSGYNNHGNVSAQSTTGYDGFNAFKFNGTNEGIKIEDNETLRITDNLTISLWVNPDSVSGGHAYIMKGAVSGEYNYHFGQWYDNIYFGVGDDSGEYLIGTTNSINTGEWQHVVVVVINGVNVSYYHNGENIQNGTLTAGKVDAVLGMVYIGSELNSVLWFDGSIDDLLIFNTSLRAEQIKALYENRTDFISSQQTRESQEWSCEVTPNDGLQDGTTLASQNLTIIRHGIFVDLIVPLTDMNATKDEFFEVKVNISCGGECGEINVSLDPIGFKAESIILSSVSDSWKTVVLNNSYKNPVIVCTNEHTSLSNNPAVPRLTNVNHNSFDIMLQAASPNSITPADVYCLILEEGNYTLNGTAIEAYTIKSDGTNENNNWNSNQMENAGYVNSYTNPVVIGQVMSYNDTGWSVFWSSNGNRLNPPDPSSLYVGKHVAEDTDITRDDEIIGYIVIEESDFTHNGLSFRAREGTDTVRGVGDSPPYTYSTVSDYIFAAASLAAMDGGNGGWAVLWGDYPLDSQQVDLAIDEDNIKDSERAHTTEQVHYIAINETGVIAPKKAGLISTTAGDLPFYTNGSNPQTINLSSGESRIITFWVNATGDINHSYEFFAFAESSAYYNSTQRWTVTITPHIPEIQVLGFTLTLPGSSPVNATNLTAPTNSMMFNITRNTEYNVTPCVHGTSNCQNSTIPFFVYQNIGDIALDIKLRIDSEFPSVFRLRSTNISDPLTASVINTGGKNITQFLPSGHNLSQYFYGDFINAYPSDSTSRDLYSIGNGS